MNKILSFLKQSNRYKHLVGGFIVGLPAPDTVRGLIRSRHRSLLAGAQRQAPGRSLGLDGLDTHRDRRSNRRIDFPRYLTRGLAFYPYLCTPVELPDSPCGLSRVQQCECEWRRVECECE